MNWVILGILTCVGAYDIYLSVKDHPTLSQQYQKIFATWIDMIILAVILTALCFLEPIHIALRIWIAGICGHICWPNKERYKH